MKKLMYVALATTLIVVIASGYLAVKMIKSRASIYPYDVTKDYVYDFNKAKVVVNKIELSGNKIILDDFGNEEKTVFIEVDVKASHLGRVIQPNIELASGETTITQYFEHGVRGVRYINISAFSGEEMRTISIKARHLSIKKSKLKAISYVNDDLEGKKIMVLSPHPDDAELAAYGLYSDSSDSYVVTITAGEAGDFKYDELYQNKKKHYLKKGELRTWDSIVVPLLGGVPIDHVVNLGFFDLTLPKMYQNRNKDIPGGYTDVYDISTFRKQNISTLSDGLVGGASWNSLVVNLENLIEKVKPDIIVTPYPALDTHPDHKFTTIAMISALKKLRIKKGEIYLYSNHYSSNEYFPYGKTGAVLSLPPIFEHPIYFDKVFSYKLSPDKQRDKIFALEAMHDLRLDTEWRSLSGLVKLTKEKLMTNLRGKENSYYKRSIRSNELFFVINVGDIYDDSLLGSLFGKSRYYSNSIQNPGGLPSESFLNY